MYTGIHSYYIDDDHESLVEYASKNLEDAFDIKNHYAFEAPFRSYGSRNEDIILLDAIGIGDLMIDCQKISIIERIPSHYRRQDFFKIPLPNEDEIALEDIRFDYFDYWKNL